MTSKPVTSDNRPMWHETDVKKMQGLGAWNRRGGDHFNRADKLWERITTRAVAVFGPGADLITTDRSGRIDGVWHIGDGGLVRLPGRPEVDRNWPMSKGGLASLREMVINYCHHLDANPLAVRRVDKDWPEMVEMFLSEDAATRMKTQEKSRS